MEQERVKIGTVVNVVGLKGELKVKNYAEDPTRYEQLSRIYIGAVSFAVQRVRHQKGMVILKVEGIETREDAETLRGQDVCITEADLPELPEGEYYIRDLIGASIVDESGQPLGTLVDILTNTAQDLYCIRPDEGKDFYLPGVSAFVRKVEMDANRITVRLPEGLREL